MPIGTWSSFTSLADVFAHGPCEIIGDGRIIAGPSNNDTYIQVYDSGAWSVGPNNYPVNPFGETQLGVVAGISGDGDLCVTDGGSVFRLDSTALTWTTTPLSGTANHVRAAFLEMDSGELVVISGVDSLITPTYTALCETYDPSDDSIGTVASLNTGRAHHTATKLDDGRVLVVGGFNVSALTSCEISDDAAISDWDAADSLNAGRWFHSAVKLDDGRVLVMGGKDTGGNSLDSCEIYDPDLDTWTTVASMATARNTFKAILLPDGKVLVTGGYVDPSLGTETTCEVYDPDLDTWSAATDMASHRAGHGLLILDASPLSVVAIGGESWVEPDDDYIALNESWTDVTIGVLISASANSAWRVTVGFSAEPSDDDLLPGSWTITGFDTGPSPIEALAVIVQDTTLLELAVSRRLTPGVTYTLKASGSEEVTFVYSVATIAPSELVTTSNNPEAETFGVDIDWIAPALTPGGDIPILVGRECLVNDMAAIARTNRGELPHRPNDGGNLDRSVNGNSTSAGELKATLKRQWLTDDRVSEVGVTVVTAANGDTEVTGDIKTVAIPDKVITVKVDG